MKVCVVTGTRAEYGLFYWLLKALEQDDAFTLQIVATGMHLSPEFGLTYQEIEADGFVIDAKVDMLLASDSAVATTKSSGMALIGLADAFEQLQPDLVVLLGDRFEALCAAQAAMLATIPIAHLHGGEATEGVIDEAIRHAISKMSHLHFPATEPYRQRLIQMGEHPDKVFNVGALGVESVKRTTLLSKQALEQSIDFDLGNDFFLVTYHPVTLNENEQAQGMQALLDALDAFPNHKILLTFPNADTNGRALLAQVKAYAAQQPQRVFLTESLGRIRYLSALSQCACVVGNSSSGIIEAPSFQVATVNIGSRQQGRARANSVVESESSRQEIVNAIQEALKLTENYKKTGIENPYDGGNTSQRIVDVLKQVSLVNILKKSFYELG